ncbi:MAG: LysR family transcriptional regulator [Woeseiaceae bacterium]|nr:LysR family transcriptional regulator [Woeseiaceae bacterium]
MTNNVVLECVFVWIGARIAFDWNRAKSFLVAVEEGSYSAAAKALGVSQPTIGRQIGELEQELKVALFERAGRGLVLTPQGRQLVRHVKAMADAAEQLSLASSGHAAGFRERCEYLCQRSLGRWCFQRS